MAFTWWLYPKQHFAAGGHRYAVSTKARTDGLHSRLTRDGRIVAEDRTPLFGPEAIRNHRLHDGALEVEAGYVGSWTTGILVRANGALVHESHPGKRIAFPEKHAAATVAMGRKRSPGTSDELTSHDRELEKWRRNRLPLGVDIACGLLFFAVAKFTNLTTAALLMAAVGVALVIAQRVTKLDLTGGLALFGIVMSLIGAGYAIAFQDDEMIKLRGTILGVLTASLFLTDGLLGGKRLAGKLARYMPYDDIDAGRLGIGMGVMGLVMAGLNYAVAKLVSTDAWLFYTTFLDLPLVFAMFFIVLRAARTGAGAAPEGAPPLSAARAP